MLMLRVDVTIRETDYSKFPLGISIINIAKVVRRLGSELEVFY